jgi:hypothetical protein
MTDDRKQKTLDELAATIRYHHQRVLEELAAFNAATGQKLTEDEFLALLARELKAGKL